MHSLIKESINITNKNLVLGIPLILFSFLSSVYLLFSFNGNKASMLFIISILLLMFSAFLSGWLFLVVKSVKNPDNSSVSILKDFAEGVGEYFSPILGFVIITTVSLVLAVLAAKILGHKFIGDVGITRTVLYGAMESPVKLKDLLLSLSESQIIKLNLWNFLLIFSVLIVYFVQLFYAPVMYFKTKNPFIALFVGLKDLFRRKFFKSFCVYVFLISTYFVISILSVLFEANIFTQFIMTMINIYYSIFAVIFVFNHYYSNFVKIGSNINTTV